MNRKLNLFVLAIALALSVTFASCSGNKSENIWDSVDLIPVKLSKKGNWSMINQKGEIVYEDEFKNTPSPSVNGVLSVKEGDAVCLYSTTGDKPELIPNGDNLKDAGLLREGLIPVVRANERITLVDKKGNVKYTLDPIDGREIVSCRPMYNEGLLGIAMEDGKMGYLDASAKPVIKPDYDFAGFFNGGLALVGKQVSDSTGTEMKYSVIDRKGNEVFKLKDSYEMVSYGFIDGYMLVKNDDKYLLLDKKGEPTAVPGKADRITSYNSKYIIFENEDDDAGVMTLDGEIVIRPKYKKINFDGEDSFFAVKRGEKNVTFRLDKNGEETGRMECDDIESAGKFGYFMKDGKTITQVDKEGKAISKEEFYEVSLLLFPGLIESDYFNVEAAANSLVDNITDTGMTGASLGESAAEVFKGKSANAYSYRFKATLSDLTKKGYRFRTSTEAYFTSDIARYVPGGQAFDPESKLHMLETFLTAESEFGKPGYDAVMKALKAKGFTVVKEGMKKYENDVYSALLKKGALLLWVNVSKAGKTAMTTMAVAKADSDFESTILDAILAGNEQAALSEEYEETDEEDQAAMERFVSGAADSVA